MRINLIIFFSVFVAIILIIYSLTYSNASTDTIITNVKISVCGDGVIMSGETCDDGASNNTGEYATSTADRNCSQDCFSWGPYCGDEILQVRFAEECDDGNNTSDDFCSSICKEEAILPPGGGGSPTRGSVSGGGGYVGMIPSIIETKVIIRGKAYPNSNVNILLDGEVIGVVKADTNADFLFSTTDITPGTSTFGFWSEDKNGLRSISFTATLEVTHSAVTNITGIFLPPTIDVSQKQIQTGELLNIFGQSIPEVTVFTYVNSEDEMIVNAETDKIGDWAVQLDTASLEKEAFHTAKAYFELAELGEGVIQSGFSRSVSFYVGKKKLAEAVSADINGDGKINLIDFSIFLINWGTDDIQSDLNQDGTVNLADFSIMLFYWTG